MKYEFFYNADYAREHNPTLMQIGKTGGFGCTRAAMLKAVKGGDMVKAEQHFWELIIETLEETWHNHCIPENRTIRYMINEWLEAIHLTPGDVQWEELIAFTRRESTWQKVLVQFEIRKKGERE